jgi:hypothetical protein
MAFDTNDYDEIRSMKRDECYYFTYSIEYIIDRIGDENSDEHVIGNTTIDVQFDWYDGDDNQAPGYRLSYKVNNYDQIPVGFNGSESDLLDQIYSDIQSDLRASGIEVGAVESWF